VSGPDRRWFGGIFLTVAVVTLVSLAIPEGPGNFFGIVPAVVIAGVGVFYFSFPGSYLLSIAFANYLAVYTCLFVFFTESNFPGIVPVAVPIGYVLPIMAFLGGALWRRQSICGIVTSDRLRDERHFARILIWLIPVFAIGAATFVLPGLHVDRAIETAAFLVAMGMIAAIVLTVSRDVATFLIDTGLLFEEFFLRVTGLIVPAFTFLTFYSLNIIVFASIYRIIERFSAVNQFRIGGQLRELTLSDSLYFSVITLSTVGYGEVTPATNVARVIVAVQIVSGILLMLFGFSEIIRYTRERGRRTRQ